MVKRQVFACIFFLIVFIQLSSQNVFHEMHPPLMLEPVVSGSFGELRSNHFHSGIDLATGGKLRYKVYSVEDGFVSRIKVSAYGYGKALYIDHPNGYTSVYAHLDDYSAIIDSKVLKEQYSQQSYSVELFPKEDTIFVKKGDVIGYSGNSGSSGGPHLHFEIRESSKQIPQNPIYDFPAIKDDVAPTIQAIKLYPIGQQSSINGEKEAIILPVVFYDGYYHLKGNPKVVIEGSYALSVKCLDYISGSWRKCGVQQICLKSDDEIKYKSHVNSIAFDETRYLNSFIDYKEYKQSKQRFQKCYIDPNNNLSIYDRAFGDGIITPNESSERTISLAILDWNNNESVLAFSLSQVGTSVQTKGLAPLENLIDFPKEFTYNGDDFSIHFKASSFYKNECIEFEKHNCDKLNHLTEYVIGKNYIPVHKPFMLRITIPQLLIGDKSKLCLASLNKDGQLNYSGGHAVGSQFETSLRELGSYVLVIDTLAPTIKLKTMPNAETVKNGTAILKLSIEDDFSGISQFNGYVDGEWCLFEYDAKIDQIVCRMNRTNIKKTGGAHELKIDVEDKCNNLKSKSYKFIY